MGHGVAPVFVCGIGSSVYIEHVRYLLLGQVIVLAQVSYPRVLQSNHLRKIINAINPAIDFWQNLWHNVVASIPYAYNPPQYALSLCSTRLSMREEKTPHNLLYKRHPAVKTVGRLLEKKFYCTIKCSAKNYCLTNYNAWAIILSAMRRALGAKKRQPRNSYISRETAAEIFLPPFRIRIFRIIVVIIRSELVIYILFWP